ncbi:hypothetical protein LINPERHAP1_LOCUS26719 [Linum perenne]
MHPLPLTVQKRNSSEHRNL